ncbi:hypothetical protein, partial [Streptomyces sp. NPDC004783]|uniref:hypothetical protein n=1 Tax=Streptomyces sp. NPDC004783 TaxID=3154459 RepID=UPI0033BF8E6B
MPAAVLTELLEISPETATAWTQSGGNWARYADELQAAASPLTVGGTGERPVGHQAAVGAEFLGVVRACQE